MSDPVPANAREQRVRCHRSPRQDIAIISKPETYRERLVKFVENQNVTLNYSERIAPAKGLSFGGKITLLSGVERAESFPRSCMKIAHEMLHRGERRTLTTTKVRETEAEAVAFVVCQSVGLQTGTTSADYVVFAVMLYRRPKGAPLLGFCRAEHNIRKAPFQRADDVLGTRAYNRWNA